MALSNLLQPLLQIVNIFRNFGTFSGYIAPEVEGVRVFVSRIREMSSKKLLSVLMSQDFQL